MDYVDVTFPLFQVPPFHVHQYCLDLFLRVLEAFLDLKALAYDVEGLEHG